MERYNENRENDADNEDSQPETLPVCSSMSHFYT